MVDGMLSYYRPVVNQSGYVLLFPNVGESGDIIQDVPVNPYAESEAQLFPLGTKLFQGERGWWYCKNSANAVTAIGTPMASADDAHAEVEDNLAIGAASAVGDYEISVTSSTNIAAVAPFSSENGLAEGYIYINADTNLYPYVTTGSVGQIYKIKANEVFTAATQTIITLYDPLTVAVPTTAKCGIIQHPCANVIACTAANSSGIFTGVANLALTASYYFWSQMVGPVAVIGNATIAKGSVVTIGLTAARVDPMSAYTTDCLIGYPLTPCVTTDKEAFMVMLAGNW